MKGYSQKLLHIILYLFIAVGLNGQQSSGTYEISTLLDEYDIDAPLYHLEDSMCGFKIEDLKSSQDQSQFSTFKGHNRLNKKSCHWIHFKLKNGEGFNHFFKDWNLHIGEADYASLYIVDHLGNIIENKEFGKWYPKSKKEERLSFRDQRVRISFDAQHELSFYIKYRKMDNHDHKIDIKLSKYDLYQSHTYVFNTWQDWLFLGFLLTMIMFNLIFYYGTKYKAYLFYGLYIAGIVVFLLDLYRVTLNLFLIRDYPFLIELVDIIGIGLADIAYIQFVRYYLLLKKVNSFWDSIFKKIVGGKYVFYVLLILFYYTTYNEPFTDRILVVNLVISYGAIIYFLGFKKDVKNKGIRYLILGTLVLVLMVCVNVLFLFFNLGISKTVMQIGILSELIAFSFGLSYQVKRIKKDEDQTQKIKELSEFKSKLLTDITHEFRTPLTVIQGVTELLTDDSHSKLKPSELRNKYDAIERNSKSMLNLINQMLDLAKLESKNLKLDQSKEDLISTVRESIRNLEALAKNKSVSLSITHSEESLEMLLDVKKLHTIVFNLVSNSIKYTPEFGRVDIKIYSQKGEQNSVATIEIRDTGIGISKEEQSRIFDRYYQGQSSQNQSVGTGIGLALVKELVELMDGKIRIESQLGSGTSFIVELPYQTSISSENITIGDESFENLDSKPFLLIVEDNSDIINYLKQILEQNYKISVAMDGQEGYDKAISDIPDLIISDVMMPKIDGIRLCEMVKSEEKTNHIPVILLTGKSSYESKLKGLKTGADAYLTKPFRKEELLVRLQKLNEQRQILQQKLQYFSLLDDPKTLKIQNSFLHTLNAVIEENLDNYKFNVEEMASKMAMSRMQLHRKLKAVTERTSSNYLRSYRLYKSKQKLGDLGLTISEIAWSVGFQDVNYYSKSFQKEFNITPSEYRKQING